MAKKPKKKTTRTTKALSKAEEAQPTLKGESTLPSFLLNTRLQGIIIFLFAFLLYANTLGHQWAQDDTVVIKDNMLTQQGIAGIPRIFSKDTFYGYFKIEGKSTVVAGGRYRPLTVALFAVFYQFFGLNPFPFHLLTVLLFAATCLVLYRTLLLLWQPFRSSGYPQLIAFFTTLLFAAHPVHTEVVANIKGCDEIVTLLASLGALYFSLKMVDTGKMKFGLLAALSLFLGLLAKENAVTFLAIIPLAIFLFRKTDLTRIVKTMTPLGAAFLLFLMIRLAVLPQLLSKPPMELLNNPYIKYVGNQWVNFSANEKYATIFYSLGQYIRLLFFPLVLTHDYYPRQIGITTWSNPVALASLFFYVALIAYAGWRLLKSKKEMIVFGILFFLITLSIVSNIVFAVGTNMGERFLFMPSIGFCLVISALLLQLAGNSTKLVPGKLALPSGIILIALTLFSWRTLTRNPVWHDNHKLAFTDVITSANSAKVQSFCGGLCTEDALNETDADKKTELFKQSVAYNTRAIEIHPTHKSALLNRGVSYYYLGQYDEAIADLRKVTTIAGEDKKGWINLSLAFCGKGKWYEDQQDYQSASQFLDKALETDSTNEEAIWHKGVVTAKMGQYAEAIPWFVRFTQIRPNDPAAWGGLEWIYGLHGDMEKASEAKAKAEALRNKG